MRDNFSTFHPMVNFCYFGVIFVFGNGAGLGSMMSALLGTRAIWCCCVSLLISFVMMFVPEKE